MLAGLVGAVLLAAALTGCGDDGPTTAEAGAAMLDAIKRFEGEAGLSAVSVEQDGTRDRPCTGDGDGRFKRVYASRGTVSKAPDARVGTSIVTGELVRVGYELTSADPAEISRSRTVTARTKDSPVSTATVTLDPSLTGLQVVVATPCLRKPG